MTETNGRNGESRDRRSDRPGSWGWLTAPKRLIAVAVVVIPALMTGTWTVSAKWFEYTTKTDVNVHDLAALSEQVQDHTKKLDHVERMLIRIGSKLWPQEKWADDSTPGRP